MVKFYKYSHRIEETKGGGGDTAGGDHEPVSAQVAVLEDIAHEIPDRRVPYFQEHEAHIQGRRLRSLFQIQLGMQDPEVLQLCQGDGRLHASDDELGPTEHGWIVVKDAAGRTGTSKRVEAC